MRKLGSSLSVGLGLALFASNIFAQSECASNEDCAAGMICEAVGIGGCPAAPDCEPGADCEPAPPCEPEEFMACIPGPCESDTDCGENMVCETKTWETCSDSAGASCDDSGNCEMVEVQSECKEESRSTCVYRWQTECERDADCGDGFTCDQYELGCDCADSAGSTDAVPDKDGAEEPPEGMDGGSANGTDSTEPPPDDPDRLRAPCDCGEPEVVNYCHAKEVECDTEADCPDGWSCEARGGASCGGADAETDPATDQRAAPPAGGSDDGSASSESDAGAADGDEPPPDDTTEDKPLPDPCMPVEGPKMCVPPGGFAYDTATGVGADAPRAEASGDTKGENGRDSVEEDDVVNDGEGNAEEPTDQADPKGDADEEPKEDSKGDKNAADDDDDGDSDDDGGCSIQTGARDNSSPLWLSALLGLALLRRRKNR